MKDKKIIAGFIITLIMLCVFVAALNKPLPAQENDFESETAEKLQKILSNQEEILQEIDNIMKELDIIKKRVGR